MGHLKQERHTQVVSDTVENFVVTSTMMDATIPAQLPHLNVFVLKISDPTDPKQDTLSRVARISDLVNLPIGRDAAVAAKATEYLTSQCVLTYTDLSTAVAGATAVKDRVSALVTDWINFQTNFNAPDPSPAIITIPTSDTSQLTALIQTYTTAKQTRYQDQLAKTASDAALAAATSAFNAADTALATVQTLLTGATTEQAEMTNASSYLSALVSASNAALASGDFTAGSAKTAFQNATNAAVNDQTLVSGYVGDAAGHVAAVQSYVNTLTTNRTAAQAALTAATADSYTKAQTLASAQTTETNALNAVLAACPDFDKTSIPLVPSD